MLKNRFRKLMGFLILAVFGFAIYKFSQQTQGSEYVWPAILSGLKFFAFLAILLGAVYYFDRRLKKKGSEH